METSSHSRVKSEDVMTTTPMKLLAHAAASQASEAQHILSVHPTSVSFSTGLTGLTFTESNPGFRLMTSNIKMEKDRQISKAFLSQANLQKLLGHSDGGLGGKTDSRHDIGICVTIDPEKGTSPLTIVPVQFQDGGQTSPASSVANSQILHYQPSSGAGDAMLSAINYNDNEMLQDGGFDVAVSSSLPNLDDGLLGSMSNPRLTENSSAPPFDLFDGEGNVNDSYHIDSLSPQTFEEGGSGLLIDSTGDAENIKLNDKKRSKPKSRQPKGQVSPEKGTMECPQCRKTFNNSSALAKHKLTHSDERKYICDVCQKAFKRQDHLNGHKMTHRDKKPYQCTLEGCEKSYCDARSLKRHLENHHQQTPEQIQQAMVIASAAAAEILAEVNNTPSSTGQQPHSSESQGSATSKSLNSSGVTGDNNPVHLLTKPQHHFLPQQLCSSMTSTTTSVGTTSPTEQPQTQYFQYDLIQQQQQQLLLQQQLQQQQQEKEKQETENHVRLLQQLQREQELQQQQQQLNTGASKWQDQSQFYKGSPFGAGQQSSQHASSPRDGETSPGYSQQISPISPVSMGPTVTSASLLPGAGHLWYNPSKMPQLSVAEEQSNSLSQSPGDSSQDELSKPVICSICQKRFKNVPALNGHMRLHGGYFKKETVKEDKKLKKGGEMAPPTGLPPRSVSGGGSLPGINQAFQLDAHSPNGNSQQGHSPFQSPIQSPGSHDSQDNSSQAIQQQLQIQAIIQQQLQHRRLQEFQHQQELQQQEQQQQLHQQHHGHHQQQLQQQQLQQDMEREQQLQQQLQQELHQLHLQIQKQHLEQQQQLLQQQSTLDQQQLQQLKQQQLEQVKFQRQQLEQHQQQVSMVQLGVDPLQMSLASNQPLQVPQSPHLPQSPCVPPPSPLIQRRNSIEAPHTPREYNQRELHQQSSQEFIPMQVSPVTSQVPTIAADLQHRLQFTLSKTISSEFDRVIQAHLQNSSVNQRSESSQTSLQSTLDQISNFNPHMEFPSDLGAVQTASQISSYVSPVHLSAGQMTAFNGPSGDNHNEILSQIMSTLDSLPENVSSSLQMPDSEVIQSLQSHLSASEPNQESSFRTFDTFSFRNTYHDDSLSNQNLSQNNQPNMMSSSVPLIGSQSQTSSEKMNPSKETGKHELIKHVHSTATASVASIPLSSKALQNPQHAFQSSGLYGKDINYSTDNPRTVESYISPIQQKNSELKRRLSAGPEDLIHISAKKSAYSDNVYANTQQQESLAKPGTYVKPASIKSDNPKLRTRSKSGDERPDILKLRMRSKSGDGYSDFMKPRMRSKSGDDYKFHQCFMKPKNRMEPFSSHRPRSKTDEHLSSWEKTPDPLSLSDGAGVFRNPSGLTGLKIRRKNRPAPLYIPSHSLNHCGFQSNLRSPRVRPADATEGSNSMVPPYTPPPMLSPIRSGSGLFWSISGAFPVSVPVTPRSSLSLSRSGSSSGSLKKEESLEQVDEEPTPETDVKPHVNVGPQYQAVVPTYSFNRKEALKSISREDIVWEPSAVSDNTDEDVQCYQDLACCAAVRGNGSNVEYALHLLYLAKGNIQDAMCNLMEEPVRLPASHHLLNYIYQENDSWSVEEIDRYQQAMFKHDKDFFVISKEVGTKTTKQCIQFYYLWKKVSPDEYKRLKRIRRKRRQMYNLRSNQAETQGEAEPNVEQDEEEEEEEEEEKEESDSEPSTIGTADDQNEKDEDISSVSSQSPGPVTPVFTCDFQECNSQFGSKQALMVHMQTHTRVQGTVRYDNLHQYHKQEVHPQSQAQRVVVVDRSQVNTGYTHSHSHIHTTSTHLPKQSSTPPRKKSPAKDDQGDGVFPCKLCSRVFYKVKSRSAHMKIHRENEKKKDNVNTTKAPGISSNLTENDVSPNG